MRTKSDIKTIFIAALTMMLLLAPVEVYGVSSKQAQYDGGTITQIRKSETGTLITGDTDLRFEYKQSSFAIPYSSITDMEYGDKPSTRIGTSVGIALVCLPCGIAGLFVKAKHHFLTLEFTQGTTKQAAVFELGKALPQTLLPILEVKTGKKVEYQDRK